MPTADFIVPPLSWYQIERVAWCFRVALGLDQTPRFPVVDVAERVMPALGGPAFDVRSRKEMGPSEAWVDAGGAILAVREDVYVAACHEDGRARFTLAHEIGHWVLHSGHRLHRITESVRVRPYQRAEPQANRFAAALLMPCPLITPTDTVDDLTARFGVSRQAAKIRLERMDQRVRGMRPHTPHPPFRTG